MGLISDSLARVRQMTDEPTQVYKYSDADLLKYLQTSFRTVLQDANMNSSCPVIARFDVTVVAGTLDYALPPNIGEILRVSKWNSTLDLMEWEITPTNLWDPAGVGWTIQGNVVHFSPSFTIGDTLRIEYVPSGEILLHDGAATAVAGTKTTVVLAASPTTGALDNRDNAYVGQMIRFLSNSTGQLGERFITAYVASTRTATFTPAFTFVATAPTYEILPLAHSLLEMAVCLDTARTILCIEGNEKRLKSLNQKYIEVKRALRLHLASAQNRTGLSFVRHPGDWV